jgi:hypothetical protein
MNRTSTFVDWAKDGDERGGRFKPLASPSVVGVPTYPAQPPNSPWFEDIVPPGPVLGIDVNDLGLDPVAEDLAAPPSVSVLDEAGVGAAISPSGGSHVAPVVLPPSAVEPDPPTTIKRRI